MSVASSILNIHPGRAVVGMESSWIASLKRIVIVHEEFSRRKPRDRVGEVLEGADFDGVLAR